MALLSSSGVLLRVFRHFFALRFAGKPMRSPLAELAEAAGDTPPNIAELLKPLLADDTIHLCAEDAYEWDGHDRFITFLLFGVM